MRRAARRRGDLQGPAKRRGPTRSMPDPARKQIAELIIDAPKTFSQLVGLTLPSRAPLRHAGAERTVYWLLAAHDEIREWRDQRAERRSRNCAVHLLWKPLTPGNFARGVMRHTRQGPVLAHVRLHTVQERVTSAAPQYFLVINFVLHRAATAPPSAMIRHLLSLAAYMLLSSAVLRAQDTPHIPSPWLSSRRICLRKGRP